jgi:16S rRNA (guanine527-N7)-methyltransferase
MTPREMLDRGLEELALQHGGAACEKLLAYTTLLAKWNKTYNLTAIRGPEAMVSHHLLDSLAVLPRLPIADNSRIADIGSGGGLPGIPLAIALETRGVTVCLNDANGKKTAFLKQATIELKLRNAEVHQGRAEVWHPAEQFGVVISRAFAELAEFIAACRHLVAPGGLLAAMKGAFPRTEIARAPKGCSTQVAVLKVPFLDAQRSLVLCRMDGAA